MRQLEATKLLVAAAAFTATFTAARTCKSSSGDAPICRSLARAFAALIFRSQLRCPNRKWKEFVKPSSSSLLSSLFLSLSSSSPVSGRDSEKKSLERCTTRHEMAPLQQCYGSAIQQCSLSQRGTTAVLQCAKVLLKLCYIGSTTQCNSC